MWLALFLVDQSDVLENVEVEGLNEAVATGTWRLTCPISEC